MAETYVPSNLTGLTWLQPKDSPGESLTRGVQVGGFIARNMMAARELAQRKAQFEAEYPIELAKANYSLQRQAIETIAAADKMKSDLNTREGMAAVGRVVAGVNQYPEKWLDPDFQKDFWSAAAANPDVAKSPVFDNIIANFPIAAQMKAREDQAAVASAERVMLAESAATEKALIEEGKLDLKAVELSQKAEKESAVGNTTNVVTERAKSLKVLSLAQKFMELDGLSEDAALSKARHIVGSAFNATVETPAGIIAAPPIRGTYDPATGRITPRK